MNKPNWIIFDVGGVLFNFEKALDSISQKTGIDKEIILKGILKDIEQAELGRKTFNAVWKEILDEAKLHHQPEEIIDLWFDLSHWVNDTITLLEQLHTAGYNLAGLTNAWPNMAKRSREVIKQYSLFTYVFDSAELQMRKPHKEIFNHVERTINATGENILFIDDNKENINAAKSLGWQVFHYSIGNDEGRTSNDIIRRQLL